MATWDAWAQEAIAHVFGATLRPGEANEHLVYVPELRDELEAERGESEPMATWDMSDRLLIARLSLADARDTSWDYIIGAWTRCVREEQRIQASSLSFKSRALEGLQHARSLLTSYAGLLLDMPDMFPRSTKHGSELGPEAMVPTLLNLAALDDDAPVPTLFDWDAVPPSLAASFVHDVITRFAPDDALDTVLGQSLHALTQCVIRPPGAPADESNQQTAVANDIHAVLAQMLGVPNPQAQASELSPRAKE